MKNQGEFKRRIILISENGIPIMKTLCLIFALLIPGVMGCQTRPPLARVVRIMVESEGWRLSVNGGQKKDFDTKLNLTNRLAGLRLSHGDVILFGGVPQFNGQEKTFEWLTGYFSSCKVAAYIVPDSDLSELFSVPVYHWAAPYDNPRELEKAQFFNEGKFLGDGANGYKEMVREIEQGHKSRIFILGSLYNNNTGYGEFETPYEKEENWLSDILNKNKIKVIWLWEWPGL